MHTNTQLIRWPHDHYSIFGKLQVQNDGISLLNLFQEIISNIHQGSRYFVYISSLYHYFRSHILSFYLLTAKMQCLWAYYENHRVRLPPSITQPCAQSSGVTCVRARCWNLTEERRRGRSVPAGLSVPDHWPLLVTLSLITPLPACSVLSPGPWSMIITSLPRSTQSAQRLPNKNKLSQSQALWKRREFWTSASFWVWLTLELNAIQNLEDRNSVAIEDP